MPGALVFKDDSLARGIEGAGAAIAAGIEKRGDIRRQEERLARQGRAFEEELATIDPATMDPIKLMKFQGRLAAKGIPFETSTGMIKNITPMMQMQAYRDQADALFGKKRQDEALAQAQQQMQQPVPQDITSRYLQGIGMEAAPPMQAFGAMPETDFMKRLAEPAQLNQLRAQQQQQAQQTAPISPAQQQEAVMQQMQNMTLPELSMVAKNPFLKPMADFEMNRRREIQKADISEVQKIREGGRDEIRKFAEPYTDISAIRSKVNKLEQARDLIKNSKNLSLDQTFWRSAIQGLLHGESKVPELLKTEDQKRLYSLMADFFNTKEIGGSNPSTREVLIAMSKVPDEFKGKETNEFIIDNMLDAAKTQLHKGQTINRLRRSGKYHDAGQFIDDVDSEVSKFQEKLNASRQEQMAKSTMANLPKQEGFTWMQTPAGMKQIPNDKVKEAQSRGAKLIR